MAKIERTKNATRNIIFGTIQKVYQILIPFLMRTAMIYCMGVEYLGLNSLFTSVLSVLNLAELGVGSAMVYSMYKPIAEDDDETICALMNLYKFYYRIIGAVILVIGLAICPFINTFIKSGVPADVNVYILYLMNLGATVLSYWLFAYKNCLLSAHQRGDISSKISMVTNTVLYLIQFYILFFVKNYYYYIGVMMLIQVVANIVTALKVDKMYPKFKAKGKLDNKEVKIINGRVRDLFTAKLGTVIVYSVDTIVISTFLGLSMLAIYQNYYYILSSVIGFLTIVFGACTAGIGNSIIVETEEKNFNDLNKFTFIIAWISGVCSACFLCLYQPFMELWVGKDLMLEFSAVICFCIYFYVFEINALLNLYKDASGIWHADRFRPLITAFANLTMNLIMVQFWGIYGIILSTVLSMLFVGMPWLLHNLFTNVFNIKYLKNYLFSLFKYVLFSIIVISFTYFICVFIEGNVIYVLIFRGIVCVVLPNLLFYVLYRKKFEFYEMIILLNNMTNGKAKVLKKLL
ncbi:MAG: lipopolysaccharide biosynthesis protein [Lachnospirales bacterium]